MVIGLRDAVGCQYVLKDQALAFCGFVGKTVLPHLHFEICQAFMKGNPLPKICYRVMPCRWPCTKGQLLLDLLDQSVSSIAVEGRCDSISAVQAAVPRWALRFEFERVRVRIRTNRNHLPSQQVLQHL